jgi:hypothetical protein
MCVLCKSLKGKTKFTDVERKEILNKIGQNVKKVSSGHFDELLGRLLDTALNERDVELEKMYEEERKK